MEWIYDCDRLADAGVINFDASAFLDGTKPRYVGKPETKYLPGDFSYLYAPLQKDTLNIKEKPLKPNGAPKWKKALFGTLIALGTVLLGHKLYKSGFGKNIFKNIKDKLPKDLGEKVKTFTHNIKEKVVNLFKKAPKTA